MPSCKKKSSPDIRIDGKVVLITGGNAGIGKETAIDLAGRGGIIYIACRDPSRGAAALEEIRKESGSEKVHLKSLDLASFASIRKFAEDFLAEVEHLHILINNAGVMWCDHMKTEDGLELQFGVNHIGHFLLTNLLLEKIKASAPSRIVTVSSVGHTQCPAMNFDDLNSEKNYSRTFAYYQSKLANIYFTKKLHRMLEGTGVTTYTLHPGMVKTELSRHMNKALYYVMYPVVIWWIKTPKEGAYTSIYCAIEPDLEKESGKYFADCDLKEPSAVALDEKAADRLWEESLKMTGLKEAGEEKSD